MIDILYDTTALTGIPPHWQDRLRYALARLWEWHYAVAQVRETERLFGGVGRYEWELRDSRAHEAQRAAVVSAHATLAEFARLAKANKVDAEAALQALGGRPAPDEEGPHVQEWRRP